MLSLTKCYQKMKLVLPAMVLCLGLLAVAAALPSSAGAEMLNNLTNEACVTCHLNYPAIKQGSTYNIKHEWAVCDQCHTDKATDSMWNCRYCHVYNKFKGGSSYWLHRIPTLSEGMNRHSWGVPQSLNATFAYHNNNMAAKHAGVFDSGCLGCHEISLTAEHNGGVQDIKEDFEDTTYNLTFSGGWSRYTTFPHAGSYSIKSPAIGDRTSTSMQTTINLMEDGKVSFWYRVSSEANYDKFYFYIDGAQKLGGISGNTGWYQVTYPLAAGSHTLKWTYVKDEYVKWFEDCVCIDEIIVSKGGRAFDCNTCHMSSNSNVKNAIANHNRDCSACHTDYDHEAKHITTLEADCRECHNTNISTEHRSRIDELGNKYTCDTCHNSQDPLVNDAINTNNTSCSACHGQAGHDEMHLTTIETTCQDCHDPYLNKEHTGTSSAGLELNCSTCHESEEQTVQDAVYNGNRECSYCHGQADHQEVHESGLDQNCLTCHNPYLSTDHNNNDVSCGYCHDSLLPEIQLAMQTGEKYCGACHTEAHEARIVPLYESDIPLYPGHIWSTPITLKVWQGEEWIPANIAANGKVLVSNRRDDLTAETVWNYYKTQMPAKGWTLTSPEPAAGASEFKVEYTREGRTCLIWFHAKEDHTVNTTELGSRLEIIYN